MRSSDCPYTVHFYGAMFREGDVWICMEVMDISLDRFYAKAFGLVDHKDKKKEKVKPAPPGEIPENVLGKIAYSVRPARSNTSYDVILLTQKRCETHDRSSRRSYARLTTCTRS